MRSNIPGRMDISLSYEYEYFNHALYGSNVAENPKNELTLFRTWNLQMSYAFSEKLSMSLLIPYKQVTAPKTDVSEADPAEKVRFTRRFSGFGDAIVMSQMAALQPHEKSPLSVTLGLGFRLPTGKSQPDHTWASGLSRDPVLQVGAGTVDPIGAVTAGYRFGEISAYASALARFSGGENIYGYRYGDEFHGIIGARRAISKSFELSASASAILTGHDYDRGLEVGNTGGQWFYFTPGITVRSGDINTGFSVQLPLYQNVNMSQLASDYVFNVNFSCGLNLRNQSSGKALLRSGGLPATATDEPAGFELFNGAAETHKPDIETVSLGESVVLADYAQPGKITLFEFYGDKCLACAALERPMRSFLTEHPDVALRKINIGDGNSEVVKQYNISVTPTVIAVDERGVRLTRLDGATINELKKALGL